MIDAVVHDGLEIIAPSDLQILSNAVENDNRIVHRVTNQRKQGCDNRQVDLTIENRKETERHQRVVKNGKHRCRTVDPLESKCNVNQNPYKRIKRGKDRLTPQIRPYFRAHRFRIQDLELALESLIQSVRNHFPAGAGVRLFFCALELDHHVIGTARTEFLDLTVRKQLSDLVERRLLLKPHVDYGSTFEIDAIAEPALGHQGNEA